VEEQLSDVQALPSLHVMGLYVQPLDGLQESVVQTLLSLHGALGVYTQPVVLLHESVVQALLSLQPMRV
jgi:hypothetical protein